MTGSFTWWRSVMAMPPVVNATDWRPARRLYFGQPTRGPFRMPDRESK